MRVRPKFVKAYIPTIYRKLYWKSINVFMPIYRKLDWKYINVFMRRSHVHKRFNGIIYVCTSVAILMPRYAHEPHHLFAPFTP